MFCVFDQRGYYSILTGSCTRTLIQPCLSDTHFELVRGTVSDNVTISALYWTALCAVVIWAQEQACRFDSVVLVYVRSCHGMAQVWFS